MDYKVTNIKKAKYQKRNDVVKSIEVTFNNSNTVLGVPINTDNDDYVDLMKQYQK